MAAKEPLVLDLFDGEYHGAWTGEVEETEQGKRPKIRPVAKGFLSSLFPWAKSEVQFPYDIEPRKNIINATTRTGDQVKILVPTEDVPNLSYDTTVLADIQGEQDERSEKLQKQLKKLRKENRQLERENERLREEDAEREKRKKQSGGGNQLSCDNCGQSHPKNKFKQNSGRCPNCGKKHDSFRGSGKTSVNT